MNFCYIVIDTLRGDHLGCYDYFRDTSPNIDRLAKEGVLFKDFYASAIATGPAFSSLITGLYPINHRFYLTPWNIPNAINFDDEIPVVAEMFWDTKKYTTVAFDNLINFRSHMKQFVRGYEFYINVTRSSKWVHHEILADDVNGRLIPWLKSHANEQFFMFVHYWDPHLPYNHPQQFRNLFHHERGNLSDLKSRPVPAGYDYIQGWGAADLIYEGDEKRSIDMYDEEIRYVDNAIGEIVKTLDELGILDDTCIVVTSDHGESLGQHEIYGHAILDEATIYLPLVMRYPKRLPQGKVVRGFAHQTDIVPTLLDLAGIKVDTHFDGRSLLPQIDGKEPGAPYAIAETGYHRSIRDGDWKLIRGRKGELELYNLANDPAEIEDLSEEEPEKAKELESKLLKWVEEKLQGREDPMPKADGPWTCYVGRDLVRDDKKK